MTSARGLRAALAALTALALAGCAGLRSADGPAAAASAPPATHAEYRLEVVAPEPLRGLLTNYLDLGRFQNLPAADAVSELELERLLRAAPTQARSLLETEGYFNAEVTARRAGSGADGLPQVRVEVTPGPRATVAQVELEAAGPMLSAAVAGDAAARRTLTMLREQWPLKPGTAFRQAAWADAKNATLARLRADGYAAASWQHTDARVDAAANRVDIAVALDSGPLFRLGELRIDGLSRYDADSVRKLSTFAPGQPYSEKTLLDFQERLQKLGLFEGASVELDADPKTADAAPVLVHVKEATRHQATVGIGYSANTGARVSLEHTDRGVFGTRWVARNKVQFGPDLQSWEGGLSSYPLDGLYRNLLSGSASRLRTDDQVVRSGSARVGRAQDTQRIERLYYVEYTHSRLDGSSVSSQADAAWFNYQWILRDLDNVLLPTRGVTASAQSGAGHARGTLAVAGEAPNTDQGPFARLYARLTWYRPLGASWYGTARVEAGQVFTRSVAGVPDTVLFRAGGDDSVRGYAYRSLGPQTDGVTLSGRTLLTGSVEFARPISPAYPAYWWAAFVDAGNAADRWSELHPALGYGVGLRWRSPVGPLRIDLAYGQRVRQVRTHLSVGIAF